MVPRGCFSPISYARSFCCQNLADAYAKSVRLCEIGLEMNNDDPNATADWLLSEAAAAWIEDVADDEGPTSTASAPSVWLHESSPFETERTT